jgi:hypothetical protein
MHAYQVQDCPLTLAEGLAAYYGAHPGLKRGDALSAAAQDFFRCHDAVHVVWGCDTSLPHEAIVKLSSFFGTSIGFGAMQGYRLYDSQDIYGSLRVTDILGTLLQAPVLVPRTILRCGRQRKKWPWSDFAPYLDRPLRDIRAEFGVRVAG